jgi:hypothetical protein
MSLFRVIRKFHTSTEGVVVERTMVWCDGLDQASAERIARFHSGVHKTPQHPELAKESGELFHVPDVFIAEAYDEA